MSGVFTCLLPCVPAAASEARLLQQMWGRPERPPSVTPGAEGRLGLPGAGGGAMTTVWSWLLVVAPGHCECTK